MPRAVQTEKFWREEFKITLSDEIKLQEHFFQENKPLYINDIVRLLMEWRISNSAPETKVKNSQNYDPTGTYEVGDSLYFPAFDGKSGEVFEIRDGFNDRHGSFRVIKVRLAGERRKREFAIELKDFEVRTKGSLQPELTPEDLYNRFERDVRKTTEWTLSRSHSFVHLGSQWLPTIMLVNFHEGHCNIADAMIDIMGVPMSSGELLTEMPIPENANKEVKLFSVNYALSNDKRFKNVGTEEQPLWYLPRLG